MPTRLRSEELFRLAVEGSPAAKIMVDTDGVIVFANATAERMFGYRVEDLVGQPVETLVPVRSRGQHEDLRRGFFQNPSKRAMGAGRNLHGARKDGAEFPVEIGLTPIDDGKSGIVLATIVDITERRKAELDLARHANDLEHANERLTQFAYLASHDLQEPLRKIGVYAGLLEEAVRTSDADAVARATSVISASIARARRMVDNLLSLSRVGATDIQVQPLDLRAEVELTLAELSAAIDEAGATVVLEVEPIVVSADRAQLARLIQNIVSNAVKYRKPDVAASIAIRAARVGPGRVRLTISDNGVGFDQELAQEIFQPFKRLVSAGDTPGTGIGLAICKAIADRHGWTLSARSRRREGSTFEVTLPAED